MDHHPRTLSDNAMNVSIFPTAEAASVAVSAKILETVNRKPTAVLGLATGQTPRAVYARLVEAVQNGETSFAGVTTFNLDEYCGLPASHPDSFAAYMRRELFDFTDFGASNINLIDGSAASEAAELTRYSQLLEEKPIDLQLLGLGTNGHIGFNEPGSKSTSVLRVVELSEETLIANLPTLRELEGVPTQAITMGIADILKAQEIVVLATGSAKAAAVRRSLMGPPTDDCPGSHLGRHSNVLWILDEAAAAGLPFQ